MSDPDNEASGSHAGEGEVPLVRAISMSSIAAMPTVLHNVPFPTKLIMDAGQLAKNWKRFKMAWANYEIASYMKYQPAEVRAATLNSCLGEQAMEVLDGLPLASRHERLCVDNTIEALDDYCLGGTNETYERYLFFTRNQQLGEKFDSYVATLHNLAKTCNFKELEDSLIETELSWELSAKRPERDCWRQIS